MIAALTFALIQLHIFRAITALHANGFDWDKANRAKREKHGLFVSAIERLFTRPLAVLPDTDHSRSERRFRAIGRTEKGRGVFIVLTLGRKSDGVLISISGEVEHRGQNGSANDITSPMCPLRPSGGATS
jgi:uncharacterized DUF497 family protein